MKLTKKRALKIAIGLWEGIVDNPGEKKYEWPGWEKHGKMSGDCPFCQYGHATLIHADKCDCPLDEKYGSCYDKQCAFNDWNIFDKDRGHLAAVEFLAQLKELK